MKLFVAALVSALALPALAQNAPHIVTAKALGPAPGAIVCHNLATVQAMFDLYSERWEERMQAAFTGGESATVNGHPLDPPELKYYGCALAKPGTRMTLRSEAQGIGTVTLKLSDGKTFSGVTQSNMYATDAPPTR